MQSSILYFQYLTYRLIFLFIFSFHLSLSDPRTTIAAFVCGTHLPNGSTTAIYTNFQQIMIILKNSTSIQSYGYDSIISPPPQIFGLSQCYSDLSKTDCELCFLEARQQISKCTPYDSARIFLDGCFLRYDNYSMINEVTDSNNDRVNCTATVGASKDDKYTKSEFTEMVSTVVENVTGRAPANDGFAVGEAKSGGVSVYVLAQCWKVVDEGNCTDCLKNAGEKVKGCVPNTEGRAMNAGCYLRYSTNKFYGIEDEKGSNGRSRKKLVATIVIVVILVLLILLGGFVGYLRVHKKRKGRAGSVRLLSSIRKSNLNFKYETLEKATNFFHPSNKLGQGGSGSVYKGTLPDGKVVAVKRLFFNTRQWVDELFNEVNLINGLQHKNLVRLLGCSIEGPESLLIYEFMPNVNLERFLFDKERTQIATWQQRIDMIHGLADGLAYLHGGSDSQVRIVHRDIKGSNILLDENLTPKIADFGLARRVAGDKSHISTAIAGTLGYMAPEYLICGQLTEKADVYAFGVLILEIVCGRKNNAFTKGSASVLQTVWKHYKANRLPETVDPSLNGNFPMKQTSKALQIGLLCTQANAALRPTMADVVKMLNDVNGNNIPMPNQPPFLNASVLGSNETSTSKSSVTIEVSSSSSKSLAMVGPSDPR